MTGTDTFDLLVRPAEPAAGDDPEARVAGAALPSPRQDRAALRAARRARRRAEASEVRRFTRSARRRRLVLLGGGGFLALAVAAPLLLAVSPAFAVRQVVVTGASPAVAAAVRARLAAEVGVPIALVDQRAVARAVGGVARVQSFRAVRLPPDRLQVEVVERTPVGQVRTPTGYALVDAAQVHLATAARRWSGYPLVVVPAQAPAAAGASAGAVLAALPRPIASRVTTLTARSADDVVLVLADGRRVEWGSAERSAAKAAALSAALVSAARGAHVIDVSAPGVVATR
ncbi:cell division protein FtsQ/DivIB [Amnibacterium sp. CER49]|uniref:cell division protein FtsQ/DivIB n=1 Tax=Amnibacterium sp. CER49 TaxID=3039161 RepID=UPI00244D3B76|nr:cell division protein FtsQ/DivIB [Amnibacterium sp. CER49]MDH2444702.1 cell division protein FtsQ/DivIB [Amnibacterium sp. CER49]